MAHRVVVSHSSRDKWVAGQIAKELDALGFECFLDSHAVETGDRFDDEIKAALDEGLRAVVLAGLRHPRRRESSRTFPSELLVLLTPAALERPYVWIEIGIAWSQGKRIIGILHGMTASDLTARDGTPAFLKGIHLRDIDELDESLDELQRRDDG